MSEDRWGISTKDLLVLDATVIVGLLFFYALSTDLRERTLIVFVILVPLELFTISLLRLLVGYIREEDSARVFVRATKFTAAGVFALFIALLFISVNVITEYELSSGIDTFLNHTGTTNTTNMNVVTS